jgi:hypothetical protein
MDQPSDLLKARTEAALLLRLDPSNLSPSDALRCDLIASLRLVVDDASTSVLDGRAPDLARLLTATESLIRLLPSEPPKPESAEHDPREIMWRTYLEMRRRGELAESYLSPQQRLEAARAKVAAIEAEIAASSAAITPTESDIIPPGEIGECYVGGPRPGPDDPPMRSTAIIEHEQPQPPRPLRIGEQWTAERGFFPIPPAPSAPPKSASSPAPAAPQYDYNKNDDWRNYVLPDGNITSTPFGGGRKYWGPV